VIQAHVQIALNQFEPRSYTPEEAAVALINMAHLLQAPVVATVKGTPMQATSTSSVEDVVGHWEWWRKLPELDKE